MGYITTTHLLDMVGQETLIVNNPFWVRNLPEKLLVLEFPELIPNTLITRDLEEIKEFKRNSGILLLNPFMAMVAQGFFV